VVVRKGDRRVQRTEQLLRGALMSLIQEKGFETLSVQDIIDRANVGRATFYAHFENKDDLLMSGLEEFRTSIKAHQRRLQQQATGPQDQAFLVSREVFVHAHAHRDVFRAMVGKQSGTVVQRLVQKILLELVREDVKAAMARAGDGAVPLEAVAQFIAAGFWGLLAWWVDGRPRLSVDEIDAAFRRMAIPALRAARSPVESNR